MSPRAALAAGLLATSFALPAQAADTAGTLFGPAVPAQDLTRERGGTDTGLSMQLNTLQANDTTQSASNSGNFSVKGGETAILNNGQVADNQIAGNSGITTMMNNTGNQVNMANSTSVIVNMR